jgi:galactose-1-phosphate uridylyltransferase
MPEFRKDPMVERWVIVSPECRQRPIDVPLQPVTHPLDDCPFCASREAMTTPAVLAYRAGPTAPNAPGWTVCAALSFENPGAAAGVTLLHLHISMRNCSLCPCSPSSCERSVGVAEKRD